MDKATALKLMKMYTPEELQELLAKAKKLDEKRLKKAKVTLLVTVHHTRNCRMCGTQTKEVYNSQCVCLPDAPKVKYITDDVITCGCCLEVLPTIEKEEIISRALSIIAFLAPSHRTPGLPRTCNEMLRDNPLTTFRDCPAPFKRYNDSVDTNVS